MAAQIALGVVVAWIVLAGSVQAPRWPTVPLTDPAGWLAEWQVEGRRLLETALRFALFGALTAVAVSRPRRPTPWAWVRNVAIDLFGLLGSAALVLLAARGNARPADLVIPLLASAAGLHFAGQLCRGWRGLFYLTGEIVACGLLVAVAAGLLGRAALADFARIVPAEVPSTVEKRNLVERIRRGEPAPAGVYRLRLSQRHVDRLLAWGLSYDARVPACRLLLQDGNRFRLEATVEVPWSGASRFANVELLGRIERRRDLFIADLYAARVGRLDVPPKLVRWLSDRLVDSVLRDEQVRRAVSAIHTLQIDAAGLELAGNEADMRRHVLPWILDSLGVRSLQTTDVVAATRAQVRHLVDEAPQSADSDAQLLAYMETAFRLARDRSAGGDPMMENRAAILALAIFYGHPSVERFVGDVVDTETWRRARLRLRRATLRGRSDWTQHFLVSAALTVLMDSKASDALGILKEQLDAGAGGSGFSFGDLLADRAGTRFAEAATRSEASARRIQDAVADGLLIDDLFPPAADLPEGLSEAEMARRFGDVSDPRFQRMLDLLERRLDRCKLLR